MPEPMWNRITPPLMAEFMTAATIKPVGETKKAITYLKQVGCYKSLITILEGVEELLQDAGIERSDLIPYLEEYIEYLAKFGKNPQMRERIPLVWEWLIQNRKYY